MARKSRKHGRYCSDKCRMNGYALRRAKALLDLVGVIEFYRLLDLFGKSNNQQQEIPDRYQGNADE